MTKIKACRKYENPIGFEPTHKLFIDANFKPVVRGNDKAMWSRLKPILFEVILTEREINRNLRAELLASESEGIMNWMIEGCLLWQEEGLGQPPQEVTQTRDAWRTEAGAFPNFLAECCVLGSEYFCRIGQLRGAYKQWFEGNEVGEPLTSREANERLICLGCTQVSHRFDGPPERAWKGIKLCGE
jgi:putative DNA primase/helicase